MKLMMRRITTLNVICYVFIPLTATWDWGRQKFLESFTENLQNNVYPDFNSNWFFDAGKIIM